MNDLKATIEALEKILGANLAVVSRLMEVEKWVQDYKAELLEFSDAKNPGAHNWVYRNISLVKVCMSYEDALRLYIKKELLGSEERPSGKISQIEGFSELNPKLKHKEGDS